MSDIDKFEFCAKCHRLHWTSKGCPPAWEYRIPAYGDEWYKIYATNAQDAAERACEHEDCRGDYVIIQDGGLDLIEIRNPETQMIAAFSVIAESIPQYTAELKK